MGALCLVLVCCVVLCAISSLRAISLGSILALIHARVALFVYAMLSIIWYNIRGSSRFCQSDNSFFFFSFSFDEGRREGSNITNSGPPAKGNWNGISLTGR